MIRRLTSAQHGCRVCVMRREVYRAMTALGRAPLARHTMMNRDANASYSREQLIEPLRALEAALSNGRSTFAWALGRRSERRSASRAVGPLRRPDHHGEPRRAGERRAVRERAPRSIAGRAHVSTRARLPAARRAVSRTRRDRVSRELGHQRVRALPAGAPRGRNPRAARCPTRSASRFAGESRSRWRVSRQRRSDRDRPWRCVSRVRSRPSDRRCGVSMDVLSARAPEAHRRALRGVGRGRGRASSVDRSEQLHFGHRSDAARHGGRLDERRVGTANRARRGSRRR